MPAVQALDNHNGTVTFFGDGVTYTGGPTFTLSGYGLTDNGTTFIVTESGVIMATITPVSVTTAGVAVTYASATAGGDTIATNGNPRVILHVKNGSGSSITVTFTGAVTCSAGALHNSVATVAAGASEAIQVPSNSIDATTGLVAVSYSAATSVTVAATVN